jgi:hypothetical protein
MDMTTKNQRRAKKELARYRQRIRQTYVRKMGSHNPGPEVQFFRGRFKAMLDALLIKPDWGVKVFMDEVQPYEVRWDWLPTYTAPMSPFIVLSDL